MTVPEAWMPRAKMTRIHLHWTGGARTASSLDRRHYHLIVEGDTNLVRGDLPITANQEPIRGNYAAHTLNANSGAIGVSLAGMAGAQENPFKAGSHPLNGDQWSMGIRVLAALCRQYGIKVTPQTVLTHAEVQANLNIKQRGKWDITRLAFDPSVAGAKAVGDRMRREVQSVLDGQADHKPEPAPEGAPGTLSGVVTASVLLLRRTPGGDVIGRMPAGTKVTILDHDDGWAEVVTPAGYRGFASFAYIALN